MLQRPVDNDFAEWAFGPGTWTDFLMYDKDTHDLLQAWNDRHGEKYRCEPDEIISTSLEVMKRLYNKHMNEETERMKTAAEKLGGEQ